jgi:hypothetical protein
MEFIDDKPVVAHAVRFRSRATISETDARLVRDGNIVAWLVRARCGPPSYGAAAGDEDDRCRLNVQVVEQVVPLDGAEREAALAYLEHGGAQGYLGFDVPRHDDPSLFDANEFGPGAAFELRRLRGLLFNLGELRDNESPVDAVRRLLPDPTVGPPHPVPAAMEPLPVPQTPAPPPDVFPAPGEPTMNLLETDDDDVEIVGRIPRSAETERYLTEAFGPP